MIPAKLIKELEKYGFELDFPSYGSNEERIIEILKQRNERLDIAIPLFLQENFDYDKICSKINLSLKKRFDIIIAISKKIFVKEGIDAKHLPKIDGKIRKEELSYFYDNFKESMKRKKDIDEENLAKTLKIRSRINTNKALSTLFAPAKKRIMDKIYNHEKLSNTELKYYYKAIRPRIHAILNDNLQNYTKIIESLKKYS